MTGIGAKSAVDGRIRAVRGKAWMTDVRAGHEPASRRTLASLPRKAVMLDAHDVEPPAGEALVALAAAPHVPVPSSSLVAAAEIAAPGVGSSLLTASSASTCST